MLFVYPYKAGSQSAKDLANVLGAKRIKHKNSKFKGTARKTVINWGSSNPEVDFGNARVLNKPPAVADAANKLRTMRILDDNGVAIPAYTSDRNKALEWLREGHKVFCRTKLTGNSGEGIVIAEDEEGLVDAPLYTVWNRIGNEYRIHVMNGQVIDMQRKARKREVPDEEVNWKVRNLAGGFIFARQEIQPEEGITEQAIKAVEALGLDFGAVDIIFTKRTKEPMVLEVNTACGLMGTTLEKYKEAFNGN